MQANRELPNHSINLVVYSFFLKNGEILEIHIVIANGEEWRINLNIWIQKKTLYLARPLIKNLLMLSKNKTFIYVNTIIPSYCNVNLAIVLNRTGPA